MDVDRTEKRKLAFHMCMLLKWGSTDMATGVCYGPDMGILQLRILAGRRVGGWA